MSRARLSWLEARMPDTIPVDERLKRMFEEKLTSAQRIAYILCVGHVMVSREVSEVERMRAARSVARLSDEEMANVVVRLGEHYVERLREHERDDKTCAKCRGRAKIDELIERAREPLPVRAR